MSTQSFNIPAKNIVAQLGVLPGSTYEFYSSKNDAHAYNVHGKNKNNSTEDYMMMSYNDNMHVVYSFVPKGHFLDCLKRNSTIEINCIIKGLVCVNPQKMFDLLKAWFEAQNYHYYEDKDQNWRQYGRDQIEIEPSQKVNDLEKFIISKIPEMGLMFMPMPKISEKVMEKRISKYTRNRKKINISDSGNKNILRLMEKGHAFEISPEYKTDPDLLSSNKKSNFQSGIFGFISGSIKIFTGGLKER